MRPSRRFAACRKHAQVYCAHLPVLRSGAGVPSFLEALDRDAATQRSGGPRESFYDGRTLKQLTNDVADKLEASVPMRLKSWQRKARRHQAELRRRAREREAEAAMGYAFE